MPLLNAPAPLKLAGNTTFLTLALLTASLGHAQPAEPLGQAVDVQLVLVDALARDAAGSPVLDLLRDDFRLFDDGIPVEIQQFSAPTFAADQSRGAAAPSPQGQSARSPLHHLVIFLDELHLAPQSRRRTLGQVAEVLDKQLSPTTQVMLVVNDGTVKVILAPTADRKKLWRALADRVLYGAVSVVLATEEVQLLDTMRLLINDPPVCDPRFIPPDECLDVVCEGDIAPLVREYSSRVRGRVVEAISLLREFLTSLANLPGRKLLLYVSDGAPTFAGQEAWDHAIELCDGTAVMQGLVSGSLSLAHFPPARRFPSAARLEQQSYSIAQHWTDLAAEANRHRITFHTLESLGLTTSRAADASIDVGGPRTSAATEVGGRIDLQGTLARLADDTGGQPILNTNDLRPHLARLLAEDAARYEFAFAPSGNADGRVHELRLEVLRPGIQVEYRKSYRATTPDELAVGAVLGSLYFGAHNNRHRIELEATEVPRVKSEPRQAEVAVRIQVPFTFLLRLPASDAETASFTIFLGARDESGSQLPVGRKHIIVSVAPADVGEAYLYEVHMHLPRGHEYVIAVAVRDDLAGTTSQLTTNIQLRS